MNKSRGGLRNMSNQIKMVSSSSLLRSEAQDSNSFKLAMYKDLSNSIHHTGWLATLVCRGDVIYFTIDFNPDGSAFNALWGACKEKIHIFRYQGEQGLSEKEIQRPLVHLIRSNANRTYDRNVCDVLDAILLMETSSYHVVFNNCRDFVDSTFDRVRKLSVYTNPNVERQYSDHLTRTRLDDVGRFAIGAAAIGGVLALGLRVFRGITQSDQADDEDD